MDVNHYSGINVNETALLCHLTHGAGTWCPGFGWNRVNFHKKPVGLIQTSQPKGIFNIM